MNSYQKIDKWRSNPYLKHVDTYPCVVCDHHVEGEITHHHFGGIGKGVATKEDDFYTVPICGKCHLIVDNGVEAEMLDKFNATALSIVGDWLKKKR